MQRYHFTFRIPKKWSRDTELHGHLMVSVQEGGIGKPHWQSPLFRTKKENSRYEFCISSSSSHSFVKINSIQIPIGVSVGLQPMESSKHQVCLLSIFFSHSWSVGYDKHSYSFRDVDGQKIHEAKRLPYGVSYKVGDVIGFYIFLNEVQHNTSLTL